MKSSSLEWGRRIAAIAQNGLTYSENPYDLERYKELRKIAAEMIAIGTSADYATIHRQLALEDGYATPKVDVRGAVFREDGILLVQERSDKKWTLPGGWADVNESPSECVVKEVREESGLETEVVRLCAVYDKQRHDHPPALIHVYKLFFLCRITGGTLSHSVETCAAGFFKIQDLPELSTERITEAQIRRMYEFHADPKLAVDFD